MLTEETAPVSMTNIAVAQTPEELIALNSEGHAAVIWERQPSQSFQNWIDALSPERLPSARLILGTCDVQQAIHSICEIYGTPNCIERETLIDDVAALADIFAEFICATHLRLRLNAIPHNTQQSYESNGSRTRLVCTYRGPETQYQLSANDVTTSNAFNVSCGTPVILRASPGPSSFHSDDFTTYSDTNKQSDHSLILILEPVDGAASFTGRSFH